MGLFDKIKQTASIWIPDENQIKYEKGKSFEQYVIDLFDKEYFIIEDWTRDNSNKLDGRVVESDMNPDLLIRSKVTNQRFAVECKWRANPIRSEKLNALVVSWSRQEQINRYQKYSYVRKLPVYVVIGLGGEPNNPNSMFCLPLTVAKFPEMYYSVIKKYERPCNKPFLWQDDSLH